MSLTSIDELFSSLQAAIQGRDEELATLRTTLDARAAELQAKEDEIGTLAQQLRDAQSTITSAQGLADPQIQALQSNLDAATHALDDLRARMAAVLAS